MGDLKFSEGPAWHPDGFLLFEDTPRNRTMRLDPGDKVSVFREPSGRANGLAWDARGRLVVCEGDSTPDGGRRVVRLDKTGKELQVLAERYQDKRLNSPNDLTIDRRGRIYFTDPRYNNRDNVEQDKEGVYRIDPDGKLTRIIDSLTRPNGIVVTPDGRTLYIADNASPGGVVTLCGLRPGRQGQRQQQPGAVRLRRRAGHRRHDPGHRRARSGPPPAPRTRPASTCSSPTASGPPPSW